MATLSPELRVLVESGPMAHVTTLNPDGSPQVSVVWVGIDGDDLVTGHLHHGAKLRNVERDPRAVVSLDAPREPGVVLNPSAILYTHATVEPTDQAWNLLDRLAKVYVSPDTTFPAPRVPGFVIRYRVERISGVGPWVPNAP
jgi:PPOX class probable F420-dependent enzyme